MDGKGAPDASEGWRRGMGAGGRHPDVQLSHHSVESQGVRAGPTVGPVWT